MILELLKKEKLYERFYECEFWINEVHFLNHVVNSKGSYVDPSKNEANMDWKAPTKPTKVC